MGFLTLLSGTFLVLLKHVNLASVCVSGLGYLAAMYFGLSMAQKKLAKN